MYAGPEMFRGHIEAQGYEFFTNPNSASIEQNNFPGKFTDRFRDRVRLALKDWKHRRVHHDMIVRGLHFDDWVWSIDADVLLVDSFYAKYAFSLVRKARRIAFFETSLCSSRRARVPPVNSGHIARGTRASGIISMLLWTRYYLSRWLWQQLGSSSVPARRTILAAAVHWNIAERYIDTSRYSVLGFRHLPEFILSAQQFDFGDELLAHQSYIGPSIDPGRVEVGADLNAHKAIARFKSERCSGRPFVYCCFGSLTARYSTFGNFLEAMIDASIGASWNLLLVVGGSIRLETPNGCENIMIQRYVPQLEALRNCDIMVSHGGINSIMECIHFNVPILVYPATTDTDQCGNAARVVSRGIGARGDVKRDNSSKIHAALRSMLINAPGMREALRRLDGSIRASEAYRNGAELLEEKLCLN